MNFVVLIQGQGEGCDYTIDCNKKFCFFKAKDLEEAEQECRQIWEDHGGGYEKRFESMTLIEISGSTKIPIDEWYEEAQEKIRQERVEEELAEAEEKVRRLRAKRGL